MVEEIEDNPERTHPKGPQVGRRRKGLVWCLLSTTIDKEAVVGLRRHQTFLLLPWGVVLYGDV